jgi:hypothetical protein
MVSMPKVSKSLARYAASISRSLAATTELARCCSSGLVSRLVSMPEVDDVSFSLSLTTRITARISGQYYIIVERRVQIGLCVYIGAAAEFIWIYISSSSIRYRSYISFKLSVNKPTSYYMFLRTNLYVD